ncbi:MAG: hypothetical protein A3K19_08295 [Lentisphaerae bacterium RIFOXYB12_FULL_65_16]|nr:MAG: hypothetical protein A3K18_00295 [Lentisphaerae bacterium RIFOXYA12_64_32]OGV89869.1 MAG: hypothetical protein A3K19_08295 [Lentisphaerae bacterium RIFOXYB12_FULL_65_16]
MHICRLSCWLALPLVTGCALTSPTPPRSTMAPAPAAAVEPARPPTATAQSATAPHPWLPATAAKLPRWRGFNLLEKFYLRKDGNPPFSEDDFRLIAKLGFNFVRLPMDYRVWIRNGDWEQINEDALKDIDQAVAWGEKYGVHVCINFHRAPGYTVAKPPEVKSIWTDPDALRVCALHWATFARRYRGIPNERVSFDLMNEPGAIAPDDYVRVARVLVEAIRKEDPARLVIADGLMWGSVPVPGLKDLGIAQATRGYTPMSVSHYKASWIGGPDKKWDPPQWPYVSPPTGPNGILIGPMKADLTVPLVITGGFAETTQMRLHVGKVSQRAKLVVEADGKVAWEKEFPCGPGQGEWAKSEYMDEWKIYQCTYDKDYTATIPAGARELRLRVVDGDWIRVSEIGFRPAREGTAEQVLTLREAWGENPTPFRYDPAAPDNPFPDAVVTRQDKAWLQQTCIEPWKQLEAQGVGVIVGEFGAFNKTPHDIALRWLEDCLQNWQQAGWGWAMWNFRGSFGVLDSDRADVQYEAWEGHKLDRKLLDLLQKY